MKIYDVRKCGDVLDRFPCALCAAKAPKDCPMPLAERGAETIRRNNAERIMQIAGGK